MAMHRLLAVGTVFALVCVNTVSRAESAGPATSTGAATVTEPTVDDEKKISIGAEFQFVLPVGNWSTTYGSQIGPLLRVGYLVIPSLEITARAGYLFGLIKANAGLESRISNIPVWAGARYFFMHPDAGLYGAGEIGLNNFNTRATGEVLGQRVDSSDSATRFGFNLGVGYANSRALPIDVRAQFMHHNLLGTQSGEKAMLGIGISVGYSVSF